jgi:hypothetical protein
MLAIPFSMAFMAFARYPAQLGEPYTFGAGEGYTCSVAV